jgi:hypothetical protein
VLGDRRQLSVSYLLLEPAERTVSDAAFAAVLVLLDFGLALLARRVYGAM